VRIYAGGNVLLSVINGNVFVKRLCLVAQMLRESISL
jgi:hypothetical protein